ncbi:MAG: sulfatase, partial [Gemmatimonadales bacterium]
RYPDELSTGWLSPLDDEYPTLAEIFRANGYRTVGVSANHVYAGYENGIDRGFGHFEDYKVSRQQLRLSSALGQVVDVRGLRRTAWRRRYDRKLSEEVNSRLLMWMDNRNDTRPFFAFLNYFDAHGPYVGRREFLRQVGGDRRKGQDRYDAAIARTDYYLGALIDSLDRRGLAGNTIVIVTADHGEQFGEHGLKDHGNSLYTPLLHVPLLIMWPERIPKGVRVPDPVTLRDVAATALDLSGIGSRSDVPGSSLSRFWKDGGTTASTPSPVLSMVQQGVRTPPDEPVTRGDMWSLVDGRWHYILNGDGIEELYDLQDPAGEHDLAGTDSLQATLVRLRQMVSRARQGSPGRVSEEAGRDGKR